MIYPTEIPSGAAAARLPMLDAYLPMMQSAALVAAGKLGLFEALAPGPLTPQALAQRIGCSEDGTAKLATFLTALGFLQQSADGFCNAPRTQSGFTRQGPVDYTAGLVWTHAIWDMMGSLDVAVQSGAPRQVLWDRMTEQPALGPLFSSYMHAFAHDLGPDLLRHVPVDGAQRSLLDLGGSHGLHAMRFCRQYPQLRATIVDFAAALHDTGARITAAGLSGRIDLVPGDLLHRPWEGDHDVVFYLSVAHNQTAANNQAVLRRIRQTLKPGGVLVIHEYLDSGAADNAFYAAFRLTLLLETGTQTYSHAEYSKWLLAAGFSDITRIDLDPIEKGSLLIVR